MLCRYYKRVVEPIRSWSYVQHAYKSMAVWIKKGSQAEQKLKRWVHRHLELPRGNLNVDPRDAHEIFCEFAYQYVNALLTFAGDSIKSSTWYLFLVFLDQTLTLT